MEREFSFSLHSCSQAVVSATNQLFEESRLKEYFKPDPRLDTTELNDRSATLKSNPDPPDSVKASCPRCVRRRDSDGTTEVMRWDLINAWPSAWRGAALDALSHEVAIESLTIVFESLNRV